MRVPRLLPLFLIGPVTVAVLVLGAARPGLLRSVISACEQQERSLSRSFTFDYVDVRSASGWVVYGHTKTRGVVAGVPAPSCRVSFLTDHPQVDLIG